MDRRFSFRALLREARQASIQEIKWIAFFLVVLIVLVLLNLLPIVSTALYLVLGMVATFLILN